MSKLFLGDGKRVDIGCIVDVSDIVNMTI